MCVFFLRNMHLFVSCNIDYSKRNKYKQNFPMRLKNPFHIFEYIIEFKTEILYKDIHCVYIVIY
jgi:hypothetical protein